MKKGSIILVPFPFTNLTSKKVRPALVISNNNLKGDDVIVCGITTNLSGPGIRINTSDIQQGSLPIESLIKYQKIITIDKKLIKKTVAILSDEKQEAVFNTIKDTLE